MTSQPPRILVAGSINTDLVVRVSTAPEAGQTVTGTAFDMFGGGKGANQAVAAARSGAAVAMLGAVGADDFGARRLADLRSENIATETMQTLQDFPSGVALITVEDSGQNRIAYVPGATWGVTPEQALRALNDWQPVCVLSTLELPHDALAALYDEACKRGIPVICNATPEPETGKRLALGADYLIVNETEALGLLGLDGEPDNWIGIGHALKDSGPSGVVITLGSSGALVCTKDGDLAIAALKVRVVDSTGAGDAFCGAFATELAMGAGPFDAARVGVVAGSLAVTKAGAQPSMPSRAEIEEKLGQ